MKKLPFIVWTFVLISVLMNSAPAMAQAARIGAVIFDQGHLNSEDTIKTDYPNYYCTCGQGFFNCICGLVSYHDYGSVRDIINTKVQVYAVISNQVLKGNTLRLNFKTKLNVKLQNYGFVQKEPVMVSPEIAKSLGYDGITILPGNYSLAGGKSVTLKVKLGNKNK